MYTDDDKNWNVLDDAEGYMKVAVSLIIISVIGVIVIINMLANDGNTDSILIMALFSGVFAGAAWLLNHNAGVILDEYEAYEKANGIDTDSNDNIDTDENDDSTEDTTDYSERVLK